MNQLSKAMSVENISAILELDKTFTVQHLTSPTYCTISSEDGSLLRNDPYGLSCLIDNIYIEQEEENGHNIENKENEILEDNNTDEYEEEEESLYSLSNRVDFLNSKGYEVICESPFEICLFENNESFASMFFANLIFSSLVAQN